ncbi:YafY family protein [Microbispora sp. GKU 823]|uniref:helix-turn-helix transcriptional regulator n=1 Tax=Microbispora sp. GKU 823 TaxID=1652100 RepID=UPI0009A2880E|nr:transcriptional regulator [Microbispora sp. GKU 823]OPG04061.1 transcriptional regulator [Microbispora sp. GKU 823]
MLSASARLLRLVSLLVARPSWTCAELAQRTAVTERTVRRDIAKLRELGYAVGDRLGEMDAAFVHTPRPEEPQITSGMLLELAAACRRGERARMSYRDWQGRTTVRDVDPYRLVHTGRRWYFVARDVARGQWRTFRADRVDRLQPAGLPVELVDPPDPALLVSRSVATGPYTLYATIRLPVPMGRALRLIPSTVGAHRPDGPDATIVEVGGPDADGLARYLIGLATPLRVLSPEPVRQALLRLTRELYEDNE